MLGKAPCMVNVVCCVVRGDRHCGSGKLVSVGLYELRHMYTHNTSLHRNTFYKKGRISIRTDREEYGTIRSQGTSYHTQSGNLAGKLATRLTSTRGRHI